MKKDVLKRKFQKLFPNGITKKEASDIMTLQFNGNKEKAMLIPAIFCYMFDSYETDRLDSYIAERIDGLKKDGYLTAPDFVTPWALKMLCECKPWKNDLPGLIEFGERELGIGKDNVANIADYSAMMGSCIGYTQGVLDDIAGKERKYKFGK